MTNYTLNLGIPQGADGLNSRMVIPFSSANGTTIYPAVDANGNSTVISTISFCRSSNSISLVNNSTFTIPFSADVYQFLFSLPYDATLIAASAVFNNWGAISITAATTDIRPFIAIATPAQNTYNFTMSKESQVYPTSGYVQGSNPASTILLATNTNLNVPVSAGTPIAIIGGLVSMGTTNQAMQQYIYMSGSLVFQ